MTRHLHWLARWRIRRLFTGGLAPVIHRALLEEVSRCASCAEHYRRHDVLESALCKKGGDPSPFALERLEGMVLDAAASFRAGRGAEPERGSWKWRGSFPRWASIPAMLVGAVGLMVLVFRPRANERVGLGPGARLDGVQIVARGGGERNVADVGMRVFRVAGDGDRVHETGPLSRADVITFTYTNAAPGIRYLALFGVQEDGLLRWYYPEEDGSESIPIRSDTVDEPLGDGIRLGTHHKPGWLRITAIFSSEPIAKVAIEQAVHTLLLERPSAAKDLAPWSLTDRSGLEHSVLINLDSSE
jgi:hypothetical protein